MATYLEIERKKQLDAIARAAFGWPDDGTRRTYSVETVIATIRELHAKAAPRETAYAKFVSHGCTEHNMQFGTCRNCGHTEHGWGQSG